ncbi:splicing factor 3B subunit 2-like [Tropilaelaps mercedesae]|uniref:Splicing factor 3B subunit 2-like n=1 Tax=Tropilaelaps mercedesae TaxID=418985 RepID=A0A1V9X2D4_9ACAR|nr:splicing factor 3B subunit 2-like [Tropilaelaps mercedesae]
MSAEELAAVDKLKVVELKARLSEYGQSTSGLKADLAARLKQYLLCQANLTGDESSSTKGSDATEESTSQDVSERLPLEEPIEQVQTSENALPAFADPQNVFAENTTSSDVVDRSGDTGEVNIPMPASFDDPKQPSPETPSYPEPPPMAFVEQSSLALDVYEEQPSHEEPMSTSLEQADVYERQPSPEEREPTGPEETDVYELQPSSEERKPTSPEQASPSTPGEPDPPSPGEPELPATVEAKLPSPGSPQKSASHYEEEEASQEGATMPADADADVNVQTHFSRKEDSEEDMDTQDEPVDRVEQTQRAAQDAGDSQGSSDSQSRDVRRSPVPNDGFIRAEDDEDEGHVSPDGQDRDEMENDTMQTPIHRRQEEDSNDRSRSVGAFGDEDASQESASQSRDTMDEIVRKNLAILESVEAQTRKARERKYVDVQEVLMQKGIQLPEKKVNETKNQKKKRRKKTRRIIKTIEKEAVRSDVDSGRESERTDVEIDYVPDQAEKDLSWFQLSKVFEKFRFEEPVKVEDAKDLAPDPSALKLLERKKPADLTDDEDEDEEKKDDETPKLSKKKLKQLTRMSVAELKIKVHHPELVEMHDVTSKDPVFLLTLKATRNSVPVPRHWCFKRKYLQGKRGIEKPPFDLPDFIKRTGICEMRAALQEKEEAKTLKSKQREKVRPKMGKIDIDYQKLHDAFFKWQEKPRLSMHGDLYYEGKEFETRLKEKKPGELSDELRTALGMPTGPNAHKCPPPWLIAMQRYGPPPSYPNLKIPGLNAAIPESCSFGYHAGGWGKPPVDETGKPLYGDVFGVTGQDGGVAQVEQDIDKMYLFGTLDEEASSSEEESDSDEDSDAAEEPDETGLVTPAEGLATPSGLQSSLSHAGLETPDAIELRKRKTEAEMEMGDQMPQLYTVIGERRNERLGHAMMGSTHTYDIPGTVGVGPVGKKAPVELALDPSELEMEPGAMAARYEQTVREQQSQLAKEDFSDMVAEHAAKQKNKRKAREEAGTAGGKKKYKEFKF